jgi:Immunoglobulin-like domain of bacterial spore germination
MRTSWKYLLVVALLLALASVASAEPIDRPAFQRVWQRTDLPVQRGIASHSWVWGPEPFTPLLSEAHAEGQGGRRDVQYFDKSRMEINDPNADASSPWFVTNGLLVNELIQGNVQVGLNKFIPLGPANIPIAGDPDNSFPTYASLIRIYNTPDGSQVGDHVTSMFLPEGAGVLPQYANDPAAEIVHSERGFGIPRALWDFMNRSSTVYENGQFVRNQRLLDWLFVMGYPTTPAFWTKVRVGGVEKEVMFQTFERRILTYTPSNPQAFRVEMGNVGRHYYQWRYVEPFASGKQAIVVIPPRGTAPPRVSSPLLVQGFENGAAFEARIGVRLRNKATGAEIAKEFVTVTRADAGRAGPFEATLSFAPPAADTPAVLEVFSNSPRDGSETILDSVDVVVRH